MRGEFSTIEIFSCTIGAQELKGLVTSPISLKFKMYSNFISPIVSNFLDCMVRKLLKKTLVLFATSFNHAHNYLNEAPTTIRKNMSILNQYYHLEK